MSNAPVQTKSNAPKTEEYSAWLGFAVVQRTPDGRRRLRVRWGFVVSALLGMGIAVWLLAGLALYFFFKLSRNYEEVRYVDMLVLPFRMQEHRREMGEYQLRVAEEFFKNRRFSEAAGAYAAGLKHVPEDLHARQVLARIYFNVPQRQFQERAMTVLEQGLPYAFDKDPSYFADYLQMLQVTHNDQKAITVCLEYLQKDPSDDKTRSILALHLATFYTLQGRFDEADKTIEKYHLADYIEGVILTAQILWDRGSDSHTAAVEYLEKSLSRFPNNDIILTYLSKYYRDMGDLDKASQKTLQRAMLNPISAIGPRIELLYIDSKAGRKEKVEADSRKLLEQFRDQRSLLALANFATDQGNVPLATRIYERAVENQFDLTAFSLLLIEAHLSVGDYQGALRFIEQLDAERPPWLQQNRAIFDSLRAVAYYGIGHPNSSDVYLERVLAEPMMRPETLVAVANRYQNLGGLIEAQRLLQTATRLDPNNQVALVQLITVDLKIGQSADLDYNLRKLLDMRRPPLDLVLDAYYRLGSDRFIFVQNRENLLDLLNRHIQTATGRSAPRPGDAGTG